jgi:hypothetical protein
MLPPGLIDSFEIVGNKAHLQRNSRLGRGEVVFDNGACRALSQNFSQRFSENNKDAFGISIIEIKFKL